jgi:hypothetical protein
LLLSRNLQDQAPLCTALALSIFRYCILADKWYSCAYNCTLK